MQHSYYNGHYGFAGAKVQHVLQADGMCYSFTCPLRHHDAIVLRKSSMTTMLSILYMNDDPLRPVKPLLIKLMVGLIIFDHCILLLSYK
jgi:hypothetical protein